jgi:biotin synthase-like enzyme
LCIESAIKDGSVFDDCAYCKYRKYAESNNVHYDHKEQLELTHEELSQLGLEHYKVVNNGVNEEKDSD